MEIEDSVSIERSDLAHMRGGVAFLMPNDVFNLVSRLVGIVDFQGWHIGKALLR